MRSVPKYCPTLQWRQDLSSQACVRFHQQNLFDDSLTYPEFLDYSLRMCESVSKIALGFRIRGDLRQRIRGK